MPGYNNTIKVADADQKSRCCGVEAIKGFKPEGTDLFGNRHLEANIGVCELAVEARDLYTD